MSCYLMNREEIGAIAAANFAHDVYNSKGRFYNAAKKELIEYGSAEEAALALAVQNIASCQARIAVYMKPMKLYGLVKTYEYQACETGDWYETDAYWYCNKVANEAAGKEQRAQEDKEVA